MAKAWTPAEEATLRSDYPTTPATQIAERLGRSRHSINIRAQRLGLKKAADYVPHGRFTPGHTPWHTGTKNPWPKPPSSAFKPGQSSHNTVPVGTYRVNHAGYLVQKVASTGYQPTDWQPVHRLVWQAAHGPIPPTHCVCFLPGQRSTQLEHITPDRLECVPKGEHNGRNWHWSKYPREVAELIHLRGTLTKAINATTKGNTP